GRSHSFGIVVLGAALTLVSAASGQSTSWKGTAGTNWSDAGNWSNGAPSGTTAVAFDANSTANLATNNDLSGLTPTSLTIANPTGAVSIGGNGMTIGSGGIDMSVATQPLTIALTTGQTITLGASQTWQLGSAQSPLTISSPIAGTAGADLTTSGGLASLTNTANTYAGRTTIQTSTIEVTRLADLNMASSIGAPTTVASGTIALGNGGKPGTLRYIGSTNVSTNRVVNLAGITGGGTLDSSGTGTVTLTSDFTATGAGIK